MDKRCENKGPSWCSDFTCKECPAFEQILDLEPEKKDTSGQSSIAERGVGTTWNPHIEPVVSQPEPYDLRSYEEGYKCGKEDAHVSQPATDGLLLNKEELLSASGFHRLSEHGKQWTPSYIEKVLGIKDTSEIIKDIGKTWRDLKNFAGWDA